MDTVEELNGTYYYAGRANLTPVELFFMIFCEKRLSSLGLVPLILVPLSRLSLDAMIYQPERSRQMLQRVHPMHPRQQENFLRRPSFRSA